MIKKRRNLFIMLVVIVLMLSATVGVIGASSNGTRFNNTILASSVADVSSSGLLTVTNQYQGIPGKTTKGEITTYIEKKTWGLFWKRVDIGEPNNEWYDVILHRGSLPWQYCCIEWQYRSFGRYCRWGKVNRRKMGSSVAFAR